MRRSAIAALPVMLTACALGGRVEAPPQLFGPTLVLDVTNGSDGDVAVGYEFESPGTGGTGEALAEACRREAVPLSSIVGTYHVTVDGKTVWEDAVPLHADAGSFLVIRVRIGPDGEAEVAPPVILAAQPNLSVAIPGCG
jgi:hypothetical protein